MLKPIIKNKKGAFSDLFIFMIFAFIILFFSGIFIYAGGIVSDKLHEEIGSRTHVNSDKTYNETISETFDNVNVAYQSLYWIAIFIIGAMILSIFIGSYMVTIRPVTFVPYIILVIIAVIVSVALSNAYEYVVTQPEFTDTFIGFWGANYVMFYLPLWISVIGIFGGIIMFVRFKMAEESINIAGGFG